MKTTMLPQLNADFLRRTETLLYWVAAIIIAAMACSAMAQASGDSTFNAPATWLSNALTGSLGRTIALGSLAVGLGIGVVQQSVMSVVVGTAIALAASVGPGVLTGILGAGF